MFRALVYFTASLAAFSVQAEPPGWEGCRKASANPAALNTCFAAVVAPCDAARAAEGDGPWLGCLSDRAAAWEQDVTDRTLALRKSGHRAGDGADAARWLALRTARCRDRAQVAQMIREHGEAETAGAILSCELINSIQRADQLATAAESALK